MEGEKVFDRQKTLFSGKFLGRRSNGKGKILVEG